jgi:signal transduction histidine kinase
MKKRWYDSALATFQDVVRAPFSFTSEAATRIAPTDQDAQRRLAFLRLILVVITLLQLFLGIPTALLIRVPLNSLLIQIAGAGLGLGCLWLAQRGQATLGSLIFIISAILGLFLGTVLDPHVSPIRAVLAFSLQALFILLASLILPLRYLGGVVAFVFAMLAWCLWGLAPQLFGDADRILIFGFLSVIYIGIAALSAFAARSSLAGLAAISLALRREQELTKLKDLFIDDINHELRTPIMAMVNNLEMLAISGERGTAQARQRITDRGLQAGRQIMAMLRSILDSTVLDSQVTIPLNSQLISVRDAIHETITTFNPNEVGEAWLGNYDTQREVQFQAEPDLFIWADPTRFRQIMLNLVSNALKYSPHEQVITIWAKRVVRPQGGVEIGVVDRGLGIPPAEQAKLFQRFVRLERDITGSIRGTGIGLYMCKRLCEAMAGAIWIESTGVPGEGTTMHLVLPSQAQT